jgi:6-phosphofructokinase 1
VAEATKQTEHIVHWLENDVGIETRATVLGHIQRGGNRVYHVCDRKNLYASR